MLEGPRICGDPHGPYGEFPCDEADSAEEKAAREKRLSIRKEQEAAAKTASEACELYRQDPKNSENHEAALQAIAKSRRTNNGRND